MLSKKFIEGIEYELQNRAFALRAIERIANKTVGTPEHIFWSSYEQLEKFNVPRYAAFAKKRGLTTAPSFFTKAKAWSVSSTPSCLLDALLKFVYTKTKVYLEDLKKVSALGVIEDKSFLDYMIAQEVIQIEMMELALNKQFSAIAPKLKQFKSIYNNNNLTS